MAVLVNASVRPSGDHAGEEAPLAMSVSGARLASVHRDEVELRGLALARLLDRARERERAAVRRPARREVLRAPR